MTLDLSVDLAPGRKQGLLLRNPVMTASGTFGYGIDWPFFDVNELGAVVTKSTTLRLRSGNPQTRTAETPAGMLNSIGLQNPGVDVVVERYAPVWARWSVPVIVSVLGATPEEYAAVAERLDGVPGVAGIEVNISSPNAQRGGMEFGQDPDAAAAVTDAVVRATTLPVIVKLTPNVADIVSVARAVVDAGASALCVINTLQAMAVDARRGRPVIGATFAGLSGPAIKPVGLRMVYQVARAVDVPIVGCGGVMTGEDALEYLEAGASAVQVGTATFANPYAPLEVLRGLQALLEASGASSVADVRGLALRDRAAGSR
ncbi:MAG TPA: dihydroorotate dehydrogenase [Dehalococcoidia bacterium]|nr:dihydroorotate dehydrogenase [Dehalococcoidia bacterium]